ncbi:MAG: hypothetical protein GXO78_09645 [Calditrichaeota bacterium]|nr:hypothetical protein [Calditrichota bacterium]
MRVWAISDLHVDHPPNWEWVRRLSQSDYREDVLIVAGDIGDDLNKIQAVLEALLQRFAQVTYVPGNHEMWVRREAFSDSLEKFHRILRLCDGLGVWTTPFLVGENHPHPVWIVPLFSWYIKPEEGEGSLFLPKPGEDPSLRMWADHYYVKWPFDGEDMTAAQYFLQLNQSAIRREYSHPIISFSHFLPRQELIFPENFDPREAEKRDRYPSFNFSRVAGCWQLDEQIRLLGSQLHVYGHQHRNRDRVIQGVRYISFCLGYPGERQNHHIHPEILEPLCIWDTRHGPITGTR